MNGNALSLGRNHKTADAVSLTDFGDCFRVDIRWDDGAHVYMLHDTKDEAIAHAYRLGWHNTN
tara:strand:+ start:283 stop:471 length:189 start_codon:yes stop_codon:yes gene_type:complete